MATTGVVGLTAGKRLLSTPIYSSDHADKLPVALAHGSGQLTASSTRNLIVAKGSSNFSPRYPSNREKQTIKALKEHTDTTYASSTIDSWFIRPNHFEGGENSDLESSLEALILLQKSMLEKQWNLSFDQSEEIAYPQERHNKSEVTRSGLSARQRRNCSRRKHLVGKANNLPFRRHNGVSPELLQRHVKGYIRGSAHESLLSHAEVVHLSTKIKAGLTLQEHKKRLEEKLGCEPSEQQLASSLRMSRTELQSKLIECSLAREKLTMSNVRLVMSIAQKYDNLGAELADLIQGGLIGLLRGIEKFDSSKGFRISTYVYWWIRQGVSRALVENSRTLRLPSHVHERLCSIRNAKIKLEEQGTTPTVSKIAEVLNMSEKKVRNVTEAVSKVFSLDRDAFPSLNGLPGETFHSYISDTHVENNPWHGFEEWSIKDEVNNLLSITLSEREQEIVRLYYGLGSECHTWEDISQLIGLSRERVRQVGLVSFEKLKHAARRKGLQAILVKH